MELGGVLAVAKSARRQRVRRGVAPGGHQCCTSQNVFDDFIAGAEWLIREQWTTRSRLAIQGGSNGGPWSARA